MLHQPYSALAEKKSVQVAALIFVVCFGIAMAVLDIRRGTLISLAVCVLVSNFFWPQFRALDYSENSAFERLWRRAYWVVIALFLLSLFLNPALERLMGRELPDIRVGNYINLYLVIHILGLVLFHKPSSPGDADEEHTAQDADSDGEQ